MDWLVPGGSRSFSADGNRASVLGYGHRSGGLTDRRQLIERQPSHMHEETLQLAEIVVLPLSNDISCSYHARLTMQTTLTTRDVLLNHAKAFPL